MKASAFDLNHVRALHFLLDEAHVARAARRLGITPAAASNALRRLRLEFDDPLLVRTGRTFARTPIAEELRRPAREVLAATERLFDARTPFEPSHYDGDFIVTTSDRVAEVLLAPLDRLLSERAPRATLRIRTMTVDVPTFLKERGGVAIVLDPARDGLRCEPLFTEEYVCVLRKGHPLSKGAWSMRRFAAAEHVLVTPRGDSDRGVVDTALAEHGLARKISRVVTSFALALPLVRESDRIATLPGSFATVNATGSDLVVRAPPVRLATIEMKVGWHAQQEGDPRYLWFRRVLREAAKRAGLKAA